MTDRWIAPDTLFNGTDILTGHALRVQGGKVTDVAPALDGAQRIPGLITPGFVDLQVNGGGGVLLNTTPTVDGMATILGAHRKAGTVAILPTVITDTPDVLEAAMQAALSANDRGLLGLHIEGPHIAQARRGTHAAKYIRPLGDHTMTCVQTLRDGGVAVMITLAPEAATPDQIAALDAMGAIVSLGHTDADAEAMQAAIKAGATCGTHLFNAMSQMSGRAAGAVGTLINSQCYVGIICDGHHVADEMIALAIRARPRPDRMMLVSDAMATVGGPDAFDLYGQSIRVQGGKLVNAEGNLAGAHVTQAQGVKRLVDHVGVDLQTALRMAITTPATCIGRPDLATLIGRDVRDVKVLSETLELIGPLDA